MKEIISIKIHRSYLKNMIPLFFSCLLAGCGSERPREVVEMGVKAPIWPDYAGVTIPVGIAPMNFNYDGDDDITMMHVAVSGSQGGEMEAVGEWADFDSKEWKQLTEQNRGGNLTFTVSVKRKADGQWIGYEPFDMHISEEPLTDWGVTYRKIAPGFETFSKIGIYQRCLADFAETPILEETTVDGQCLNCHYANRANPAQYSLHVRGKHGGTLIHNESGNKYLHTKTDQTVGNCTYGYWHPGGRYCAYSLNRIYQNFYVGQERLIEPWDAVSDIVVLDTHDNTLLTLPALMTEDCETTPAFSADGSTLYFCRAPKVNMPGEYQDLKYSLCAIPFDSNDGQYGDSIYTVISADSIGQSVSLPRPSYDGRYLMYCLTDYGTNPVDRPEADLWLMDLQSGETRPIDEVNSAQVDGYHNWSSQGGWFLFSSKREDSLYALLYLSRIGEDGIATKPFLLPQRNPKKYYGESLHSFNAPDFTSEPVDLSLREAKSLIIDQSPIHVTIKEDGNSNP